MNKRTKQIENKKQYSAGPGETVDGAWKLQVH